jgi:hypothetical protein
MHNSTQRHCRSVSVAASQRQQFVARKSHLFLASSAPQSASQHNLQSVSVAAPATFFWHRQRRSTILKAQSRSSQKRLQSYVPDCFFCSHHKSLYASCASKLQNPYTPHTSSSEDYAHTEDDRNEAADASWVEAFALVCIHAF